MGVLLVPVGLLLLLLLARPLLPDPRLVEVVALVVTVVVAVLVPGGSRRWRRGTRGESTHHTARCAAVVS